MSQPLGDQRRRPIGVIPSSEPPRVVDSAFAPERDARQPLQQTAPSAPNFLVGDPCDLMARALAILADEAEAWQIRPNANVLPRSLR